MVRLIAIILVCLTAAGPALAQDLPFGIQSTGALSERSIQLLLLITVFSIVPGIAIMVTCFPFMVTVFAILRQAIGLQQSPPNMLIVTLALFLTYFVMEPVFLQSWELGIAPMVNDGVPVEQAFGPTMAPFRDFMSGRVAVETFVALADLRPDVDATQTISDAPLSVLVPSFLLSEMSRAFEVGFLIFLPFLIIDLIVTAVLMSMGMMMVPPAIVSLPFKLAFFVVADGWALISGTLVRSYF